MSPAASVPACDFPVMMGCSLGLWAEETPGYFITEPGNKPKTSSLQCYLCILTYHFKLDAWNSTSDMSTFRCSQVLKQYTVFTSHLKTQYKHAHLKTNYKLCTGEFSRKYVLMHSGSHWRWCVTSNSFTWPHTTLHVLVCLSFPWWKWEVATFLFYYYKLVSLLGYKLAAIAPNITSSDGYKELGRKRVGFWLCDWRVMMLMFCMSKVRVLCIRYLVEPRHT